MDGKLYFGADDGTAGMELWVHDPAASTTTLVADICPGPGWSFPHLGTSLDGELFFSANDGTTGYELWVHDPAGRTTTLTADIRPGPGESAPSELTVLDGKLFFKANDGTTGQELWVHDPASNSTTLVADIGPGPSSSFLSELTALDGKLVFRAHDGETGRELWVHDSASSTTTLIDILPGPGGSFPRSLTNVEGVLVFSASDFMGLGNELWRSDGTEAGTFLVQDIAQGPSSSNPGIGGGFVVASNQVFFDADDDITCVELWGGPVGLVDGHADLSISKIDSRDPVAQGRPFSYTLTVRNGGPAPGTGVLVVDVLPPEVSFVTATPTQGECSEDGGTVACEIGDLPVATSTTVSISVTSMAVGPVINTATVTASMTDPDITNNSATEMTNVVPGADLTITKDNGQAEVIPGELVNYTISVGNAGPSDAFGATVMDIFPPDLSNCSWTCSGSDGATCTGGPVVGNISDNVDLPVAGSLSYTLTCHVDLMATTTVANRASILTPVNVVDPNSTNDSSTDTDVVLGPCGFPNDRVLEYLSVDSAQVFQACNSITAGPGFEVIAGGTVTFRAGQAVILSNGCSVDGGAKLSIEIDPLLASN